MSALKLGLDRLYSLRQDQQQGNWYSILRQLSTQLVYAKVHR